jgi:hypothetical protein
MRPMRLQTPVSVVVVLVAATAMSAPYCRSYSRAAAVFAGMVQLHGRAAGALEYERQAVTIEMATVPTRHGDLRTRLSPPASGKRSR